MSGLLELTNFQICLIECDYSYLLTVHKRGQIQSLYCSFMNLGTECSALMAVDKYHRKI